MSEPENRDAPSIPINKRKTISKGLRFDILNRDGFKCRYCGTPGAETKLVVDHIIAVANGGPTVADNLITACEPCNQGKKAKHVPATAPSREDAKARERERRAVNRLAKQAMKAMESRCILRESILTYWCNLRARTEMDSGTLNVMTSFARQHGPELVFAWIKTAVAAKPEWCRDDLVGCYVSGIRRKWLETLEMRNCAGQLNRSDADA